MSTVKIAISFFHIIKPKIKQNHKLLVLASKSYLNSVGKIIKQSAVFLLLDMPYKLDSFKNMRKRLFWCRLEIELRSNVRVT